MESGSSFDVRKAFLKNLKKEATRTESFDLYTKTASKKVRKTRRNSGVSNFISLKLLSVILNAESERN